MDKDIETLFSDVLATYPGAKKIKKGGQKAVYEIQHPKYGRVVLKIGCFSLPQTLERIRREVETLKSIDSPYYPKNFEFKILDANRFLIIEEFIESKMLSDCTAQFSQPKDALNLIRELTYGLMVLWKQNKVHRDVKPDNILVTKKGEIKIIDLGILRNLDEESITATMAPRGPATPIYAAPEQLLNKKSSIDFRTDQFNLGIILAQLVYKGIHPFDPHYVGEGTSITENICAGKWYKAPFQSPDLKLVEPICTKLLGNQPYMRYRTPFLLLQALTEIIGG